MISLEVHLNLSSVFPEHSRRLLQAGRGIVLQILNGVTFLTASSSHPKSKGLKSLNLA